MGEESEGKSGENVKDMFTDEAMKSAPPDTDDEETVKTASEPESLQDKFERYHNTLYNWEQSGQKAALLNSLRSV